MFLCVPVFVSDGTLCNIFGTSLDIFGYYQTPMKNLGTLKIKNVTPINVKRLRYNIVKSILYSNKQTLNLNYVQTKLLHSYL